MDNMKIIKHFYEYVTSNNLIDEISEYIAEDCVVRIGDRIIPVGIEGMKPTGKKLRMTGVDIDRLVDGKIVEHGGAVNTFEALFEEGIIKPA